MAANAASPLVMRIISASVAVSHRAGRIIRDVMEKGQLGIVEKGKNDFQTQADRSAQRCIVASLHRQFPKVSIFGEEDLDPSEKIEDDFIETNYDKDVFTHQCPDYLQNVQDEEVVIWVDPLDGTAEYTQGLNNSRFRLFKNPFTRQGYLDHVTVLIGVAVKGTAVGGVIYQPYYNYLKAPEVKRGRCIWGVVGLGSFGFEHTKPPADQNIITTSRSHSNRIVTESVEACEPTEVVRVGGAGHKVLLLIEGLVHAYVFASPGCKKWDTCAPEAVLHAVGGTLTDIHGNKIYYHKGVQKKNSGGVLATLGKHNWYVERIPEHVKESLPLELEKSSSVL